LIYWLHFFKLIKINIMSDGITDMENEKRNDYYELILWIMRLYYAKNGEYDLTKEDLDKLHTFLINMKFYIY